MRRAKSMPRRRSGPAVATMQVWPVNNTIRKILKHPIGGGFTGNGGAGNWPRDQFTYRRLRDGDITEAAPAASAESK